jgi:hypothetical protein
MPSVEELLDADEYPGYEEEIIFDQDAPSDPSDSTDDDVNQGGEDAPGGAFSVFQQAFSKQFASSFASPFFCRTIDTLALAR